MKKFFLLAFLCLAFLICGCAKDEKVRNSNEKLNISKDAVVLAAPRHLAPGQKDAMYCSKILGVWEPLITHNDDGTPKPCLAESWEMHDGGKKWIFHLRKNVYFHNGKPFTADSVIANFDRMNKGYKRSNFYGLNIKVYYPTLKKYEKLDDYTIGLTFEEPNVNQLYKMMDFGSPMFAPECLDKDGNFNGIAIGTGQYIIKKNVLNKYVHLVKNENYYGEKGHINEYIIRNIPSAEVRYAALKAGEIWGVLDINCMPPFLAPEVIKDPNLDLHVNKSTMTRFLNLNGKKFPFNDIRMRQAVSLAIDRNKLVNGLYLGYAYPTQNVLNYTSPYWKEFPVTYDLDKAKLLAKQVLGDERCDISYVINGADPLQKGEAELIAYWLKDIGLDVTIKSMEYGTMSAAMRKGEYNIARTQQGLPNGDPYSIIYTFMMPDGARNISASAGYKSDEVVRLMDEVKHTVDEGRRHEIYNRLQEISIQEVPMCPLYNDKTLVAYNKKLKNYEALIYGVKLEEIELVK